MADGDYEMNNNMVSIVVRTVGGRSIYLDNAFFSVYANGYPDKEVILVYQGLNADCLAELDKLVGRYCPLVIKILQNPTCEDQRARNLNIGIREATGRYLCFLDDDDILYPNHLQTLVGALRMSGKAWAYSQVCMHIEEEGYLLTKRFPFLSDEFSYERLWRCNYIPIHSFMIDKYKIENRSLLCFFESNNRNEDYVFLLWLAQRYEPAVCDEVTCAYRLRTDGSNTNVNICEEARRGCGNDSDTMRPWKDSEKIIAQAKSEILSRNHLVREMLMLKKELESDKGKLFGFKTKLGPKRRFELIARMRRKP